MSLPQVVDEGDTFSEQGNISQLSCETNHDDELVCTWQTKFKASASKDFGYVQTVEEAMAVIKQYELDTTTKFSCYKADKMFGSGGKKINLLLISF